MTAKQIISIHGGNTYPSYESHLEHLKAKEVDIERLRQHASWRAYLQKNLGADFDVLAPKMPLADNASYNLWKLWFEQCATVFDDTVLLLGHSLGAIFLAKYLAENKVPYTVQGLFLVAPPYNHDADDVLPENWQLPKDLSLLAQQVSIIHIYHSEDDPVVPIENALKYTTALPDASFHRFKDRGHFLGKEFPEILEDIRNVIL